MRYDPVSFSFVMATGILSIAFFLTGWAIASYVFLGLASAGYVLLVVQTFFAKLDWMHLETLFKMLTFSAGTSTLAIRYLLLDTFDLGLALGIVGIGSCFFLVYTLFGKLFFHAKESIQRISPYWLLMCIALHACGIVLSSFHHAGEPVVLLSLGFWSFGLLLYIMFMCLNLYRMFFFGFTANELSPSYWTCMGAAAIAVTDGIKITLTTGHPFLNDIKPFIVGMSLILWCFGTAWIPILVLMGLWKFFYFKAPFVYQANLWTMVFPLGMYTACTHFLASEMQIWSIKELVEPFLWITVAAWSVVALLFVRDAAKSTKFF